MNDDWLMLIIWSTASCVMVGLLLHVLYAGELSCFPSNVGVFDTLGDGVILFGAVVVVLLGDTLGVVILYCISGGGSSCVVVGLMFFTKHLLETCYIMHFDLSQVLFVLIFLRTLARFDAAAIIASSRVTV